MSSVCYLLPEQLHLPASKCILSQMWQFQQPHFGAPQIWVWSSVLHGCGAHWVPKEPLVALQRTCQDQGLQLHADMPHHGQPQCQEEYSRLWPWESSWQRGRCQKTPSWVFPAATLWPPCQPHQQRPQKAPGPAVPLWQDLFPCQPQAAYTGHHLTWQKNPWLPCQAQKKINGSLAWSPLILPGAMLWLSGSLFFQFVPYFVVFVFSGTLLCNYFYVLIILPFCKFFWPPGPPLNCHLRLIFIK